MSPSADLLLDWYDRHARRLPWRVGPAERRAGIRPDPYRVWLSEVMLQQTTVTAVKPYFEAFLSLWPTVADLAAAPVEDVMKAWAGLGYYSRARNLKACADAVMRDHGGRFPGSAAALRDLPGIGDYTAAAIAAIAYDEPAAVVDGNVERVLARVFKVETPLPAAKKEIRVLQARLTPAKRAGDYAQAMMDLGATICTPKRPACSLCPWDQSCAAHASGVEEAYPRRGEKADRPERGGAAFVAIRADGAILMQRRPERGLLGGMTEVPGTAWSPGFDRDRILADAPFQADWRRVTDPVIHVFTHFRLTLDIWLADLPAAHPAPAGSWWAAPDDVPHEALPSVMKKAIEAARPGATRKRK
ncbi:A/G-specific adenine glycosylase [Kaistia dalseonensis]|uniref:Adenine DNA glycosylase n=1 Tax=Kaistia dalseonensis TaxID=410840 RepID=A0ABU0HEE2_9HYPH|nr:A/G-specific adenine glycosylase [Kaistia dalseonensis]MCX5497471.1 A/G-specific adenine glycosylase [Kaistia dalseonensis]MDQ0440110.1 A/G-specific adenine glycosylase [Kaistia dalseonensis]